MDKEAPFTTRIRMLLYFFFDILHDFFILVILLEVNLIKTFTKLNKSQNASRVL